jgi:hypothetical protein
MNYGSPTVSEGRHWKSIEDCYGPADLRYSKLILEEINCKNVTADFWILEIRNFTYVNGYF